MSVGVGMEQLERALLAITHRKLDGVDCQLVRCAVFYRLLSISVHLAKRRAGDGSWLPAFDVWHDF